MRVQKWLLISLLAITSLALAACGDDDDNNKPVPAAPTEVTATGGFNQVTLSWGAVENAKSYNIYWSTASGVTPANGTKIANVTSPYVQMELTAGTTYFYVVTAKNGSGESAPSDEVSATPTENPTVPVAPTGVTATAGVNQVSIAWTAVSDAMSYNIYWSTTSGVTPATGTQIAGATSPHVQTGLTAGTTYFYVVTAVNAVGESDASAEVSATPTSTPNVPAAPTGVSATPGNGQVSLSWAPVSGATSFNIYWSTTSGVTPATGTPITNATSPFVQTGLTNGTTYFYVVTAQNSAGQSNPSAEVSATPSSTPAVPPAPTGVVATGGTNSVTISWNAVTGASSYNLYWSTTSGVTTATGTPITNVVSPYLHQPLDAATTYFYIITAVNGAGEGPASSQVSATTSAIDGVALYNANCSNVSCHGPLATSSVRGRSAAQIQAAINANLGGMSFLSFLTPEQIQAIANVLNF
jgi:fibronectin type 3 domain-containing protein